MTRRPDWPDRLEAAIEAARLRPFSWGEHDCAGFAADVVLAISGVDPMAALRGSYTTQHAAVRLMARGGGLANMTTAALGEPCAMGLVGRGDVVLACTPLGPSLGICLGVECAFVGPDGLVMLRRSRCEQGWRI